MWAFEGAGNAIYFREHENVSFSIHGNLASQDCRPAAGDLSILEVIEGVKAEHDYLNFSIFTSQSEEHEIHAGRVSLQQALQAKPTRSHAMITYLPKDGFASPTISVTVILCDRSIERVFDMYKRLFGRADLRHRIIVDFIGLLPKPRPESNVLSLPEFTDPDFLNNKPYVTDSVDFRFYSQVSESAPIQAQEVRDALAGVKQEIVKFGQWIGIAVTIIAFIVVLSFIRH
jgi:hypothetical protein